MMSNAGETRIEAPAPRVVAFGQQRITRPTPELEANPRYQVVREIALRVAAAVMSRPQRDREVMMLVSEFQAAAGVVGEGERPSGLYGPATVLAMGYFLPATATVPRPWSNTTPGSWSPPLWTREVTRETRRTSWWLVAVLAGAVVTAGVLVAVGIKDAERRKRLVANG